MGNLDFRFIAGFVVLFFCSNCMQAQIDTVAGGTITPYTDTTVLSFAEEMPKFPGGQQAMELYLQHEVKYPKEERNAGKQGTVYVTFIVERDGRIDSAWLAKGVANAPGLGVEAVRVMKAMPQWEPGRMNGKPVRVEMTIPIKFVLEDKKKKRK